MRELSGIGIGGKPRATNSLFPGEKGVSRGQSLYYSINTKP